MKEESVGSDYRSWKDLDSFEKKVYYWIKSYYRNILKFPVYPSEVRDRIEKKIKFYAVLLFIILILTPINLSELINFFFLVALVVGICSFQISFINQRNYRLEGIIHQSIKSLFNLTKNNPEKNG